MSSPCVKYMLLIIAFLTKILVEINESNNKGVQVNRSKSTNKSVRLRPEDTVKDSLLCQFSGPVRTLLRPISSS